MNTSVDDRARPLSFLAVCFGFLVVMAGTTLPTPLYVLYQDKFGFGALTITILFAVYALTVVATLLILGRASDDLGRKPVLIAAAALSVASAVCFLTGDNLEALMIGRVLSGISAGLVTGTGTATLLDLGGHSNRARSSTIAVAVNAGGLGLGTAGAGVVADVFANPLLVPFWIHLVLAVMALVALATYKATPPANRTRIHIQRPTVPKEVRGVFARSALAAGSGFAVTGVLTAVVSLFLVSVLDNESHALAGGIVGLALVSVAAGQLIVRRLREEVALPVGCIGLALGSTAIALALLTETLAPLIAGAIVVGLSTGLETGAGLRSIATKAAPEHRAAAASTFFAVLYTMLAVPTIAVGVLEELTDLTTAGVTFSAAVAALATVVLISLRTPKSA
jgi:MFS family permease